MWASFNTFEINITKKDAKTMSHQGNCITEVRALLPKYEKQLKKIGNEKIASELKEYGAWDKNELKDEKDNFERILWIASGNILEDN